MHRNEGQHLGTASTQMAAAATSSTVAGRIGTAPLYQHFVQGAAVRAAGTQREQELKTVLIKRKREADAAAGAAAAAVGAAAVGAAAVGAAAVGAMAVGGAGATGTAAGASAEEASATKTLKLTVSQRRIRKHKQARAQASVPAQS